MTPKHTLLYSQKQDAERAQSRPPGATVMGPVPNGSRSQVRASSGPYPASSIILPLDGDPLPSRAEAGKSLRLPRSQDFTQNQYLGTYPKNFQFSRIEFRWDFIPGRNQISVRLTLGLRKLAQAFRSLQTARTREDGCLPRLCQTPPAGPDRVLMTLRRSRGVVSCVALGLPGHPPKGGAPRYPPREVLREWSRPVPGSYMGAVSRLRGGVPHICVSVCLCVCAYRLLLFRVQVSIDHALQCFSVLFVLVVSVRRQASAETSGVPDQDDASWSVAGGGKMSEEGDQGGGRAFATAGECGWIVSSISSSCSSSDACKVIERPKADRNGKETCPYRLQHASSAFHVSSILFCFQLDNQCLYHYPPPRARAVYRLF